MAVSYVTSTIGAETTANGQVLAPLPIPTGTQPDDLILVVGLGYCSSITTAPPRVQAGAGFTLIGQTTVQEFVVAYAMGRASAFVPFVSPIIFDVSNIAPNATVQLACSVYRNAFVAAVNPEPYGTPPNDGMFATFSAYRTGMGAGLDRGFTNRINDTVGSIVLQGGDGGTLTPNSTQVPGPFHAIGIELGNVEAIAGTTIQYVGGGAGTTTGGVSGTPGVLSPNVPYPTMLSDDLLLAVSAVRHWNVAVPTADTGWTIVHQINGVAVPGIDEDPPADSWAFAVCPRNSLRTGAAAPITWRCTLMSSGRAAVLVYRNATVAAVTGQSAIAAEITTGLIAQLTRRPVTNPFPGTLQNRIASTDSVHSLWGGDARGLLGPVIVSTAASTSATFQLAERPAPRPAAAVVQISNPTPVVGNLITISASVYDQYGTPWAGQSIDMNVITPNGTSVGLTVNHQGGGSYWANYTASSAGAHNVVVSGTQAIANTPDVPVGVISFVAQPSPTQVLVRRFIPFTPPGPVVVVDAGAIPSRMWGKLTDTYANGAEAPATVPFNWTATHTRSGGTTSTESGSGISDGLGQVAFAVPSRPADTVETTVDITAGPLLLIPGVVVVTSTPSGQPTTLVLTPVSPNVVRNGSTNLVADVTSQYGQPSVGVTVTFSRKAPDGSALTSIGTAVTNTAGRATLSSGALDRLGPYAFQATTGLATNFTAVETTPAAGDQIATTVFVDVSEALDPAPVQAATAAVSGTRIIYFYALAATGSSSAYMGRLVVKVVKNGAAQPDLVFATAPAALAVAGRDAGLYSYTFTPAAGDTWEFVAFADPDGDSTPADADATPAVHVPGLATHATFPSNTEAVAGAVAYYNGVSERRRGQNIPLGVLALTTAGRGAGAIGANADWSVMVPGATTFTPFATNDPFDETADPIFGGYERSTVQFTSTVAGRHVFRAEVDKGPGNTTIPAYTAVEVLPASDDVLAYTVEPVAPGPAVVLEPNTSYTARALVKKIAANGTVTPAAALSVGVSEAGTVGAPNQSTATTDASGIASAPAVSTVNAVRTWLFDPTPLVPGDSAPTFAAAAYWKPIDAGFYLVPLDPAQTRGQGQSTAVRFQVKSLDGDNVPNAALTGNYQIAGANPQGGTIPVADSNGIITILYTATNYGADLVYVVASAFSANPSQPEPPKFAGSVVAITPSPTASFGSVATISPPAGVFEGSGATFSIVVEGRTFTQGAPGALATGKTIRATATGFGLGSASITPASGVADVNGRVTFTVTITGNPHAVAVRAWVDADTDAVQDTTEADAVGLYVLRQAVGPPPPQATIVTITPAASAGNEDTTFAFTVNVKDQNASNMSGQSVTAQVAGANGLLVPVGTVSTDASGNASFSYVGNNPGADLVVASTGVGTNQRFGFAVREWTPTAVGPQQDFYEVVFDQPAYQATVGTQVTVPFTAHRVRRFADPNTAPTFTPFAGTVRIYGPNNPSGTQYASATTNALGRGQFTYTPVTEGAFSFVAGMDANNDGTVSAQQAELLNAVAIVGIRNLTPPPSAGSNTFAMSDYVENGLLDLVLRRQPFTVPTVYVSLHTANPGDAPTPGGPNEVRDTNGAINRRPITFSPAAGGAVQNAALVPFLNMPAATVTHFGLWDSPAGLPTDRLLFWGTLSAQRVLAAGDSYVINPGGLTVSLD